MSDEPVEEPKTQTVNVRPLPTEVSVGTMTMDDGRKLVQVVIGNMHGIFTAFYPPNYAREFAEALVKNAEDAEQEAIVVPKQSLIVPGQ